jgi:hypothetical protein
MSKTQKYLVKIVYENNCCSLWESYKTHKICKQNAELMNI